ncbi:hypothetical protein Ssi02_36200 [Sinosporangium siamense]|uniref:Uncharacterized protein n=2 Tax=Sinosporangium siamense TaxID=1367973 RepID=A0A919RJA3_9ACTN|nr:hypothetical protein Ssi02_36200 [Sinosporangium siamense]
MPPDAIITVEPAEPAEEPVDMRSASTQPFEVASAHAARDTSSTGPLAIPQRAGGGSRRRGRGGSPTTAILILLGLLIVLAIGVAVWFVFG